MRKKPLLIFDLDGTLYRLPQGSYAKSKLRAKVEKNATIFLSTHLNTTKTVSRKIFDNINRRFRGEISLGLEKVYDIDRYTYFNFTWNISPVGIVRPQARLRRILLMARRDYRLILLSDAPKVWIHRGLKHLQIEDLFSHNIFSGEGNIRKSTGNPFRALLRRYDIRASVCVSVGDQEISDIVPAKKLGMITIYIHPKRRSLVATFSVQSIRQLPKILTEIKTSRD